MRGYGGFRSLMEFCIFLKVLASSWGFGMGGDPIRCMSEKDCYTSSVKGSSDRDLKPDEHLIGRIDAKRNIVRTC